MNDTMQVSDGHLEEFVSWMKGMQLESWVSTITICFKTCTNIDIERIRQASDDGTWDAMGCLVRTPKDKKNRNKHFRFFNNSISLVLPMTKRHITVKVFRNGSFHITGSKTYVEALSSVQKVFLILKDTCGYTFQIQNMQTQMINLVTHIPRMKTSDVCFDMYRMHDSLSNEYGAQAVVYNPDSYIGMKVKLQEFTVLIFAKGCFILTGIQHPHRLMSLKTDIQCLVQNMMTMVC